MLNASHIAHERLRETAEGLEKLCAKCDEWWPADREFFFSDPEGVHRLFYCCKACYREHLDPRRLDRPTRLRHEPLPFIFWSTRMTAKASDRDAMDHSNRRLELLNYVGGLIAKGNRQ